MRVFLYPMLAVWMIGEPCYGLEGQDQVEGRHLWVEYDNGLSTARATSLADASDAGWEFYEENLGWPTPPEPIGVRADLNADGAAGQCITVACGDVDVPRCLVFGPAFSSGAPEVTGVHEIAHAFQYGLMGNYVDSLASWAWWMEGTAEYMAHANLPNPGTWNSINAYMGNPEWTLHHDFSEFVSGTRTQHMYGTAVLAFFIDEYYGGPDTVRQIWEWGAARSGERIFFPDAIDGAGIDFDAFWAEYLARITVVDLAVGSNVPRIPAHTVITGLPGAGPPPPDSRPEGMGIGVIHLPADLGAADMDLEVVVSVDTTVPWHAVLARTSGTAPGSEVLEYLTAEFDDDGEATLLLPNFDGSNDAFLAVSPEAIERTPFDYELAAQLVPSPVEPMGGSSTGDDSTGDETMSADDTSSETGAAEESSGPSEALDDDGGCNCRAAPSSTVALWMLPLLGAARRRKRTSAAQRPVK